MRGREPRLSRSGMRIRRGEAGPPPHFLGVGAPRTGTKWLAANLRRHPEIWLTPVKEVHYFDKRRQARSKNRYYRNHLRKRMRRYRQKETYKDALRRGDSGFLRNL